MKEQLQSMGFSTTGKEKLLPAIPDYYKWTNGFS